MLLLREFILILFGELLQSVTLMHLVVKLVRPMENGVQDVSVTFGLCSKTCQIVEHLSVVDGRFTKLIS